MFDLKQKLRDGFGLSGTFYESKHSPVCESSTGLAVMLSCAINGWASSVMGISLRAAILSEI